MKSIKQKYADISKRIEAETVLEIYHINRKNQDIDKIKVH
jgi:hypothetical protein